MFHDVAQNSEEWFRLRCGKITGSQVGTIMVNNGKAFGDPAKKKAVDIAIERISGEPTINGYTNEHMQRGQEQEPIARALYEDTFFCDVTNGGFFSSGIYGVSPDGLVGGDGGIEIKCVVPSVHYNNIKRGGIDPAYKWQFFLELMVTERAWFDFVSYCSLFPEGKKLYTHRVYREECLEKFREIQERVEEFDLLVFEIMRNINEKA